MGTETAEKVLDSPNGEQLSSRLSLSPRPIGGDFSRSRDME